MPIWRRSGGKRVTSCPPMMIDPRSGARSPATSRRVVVFPHPEGPRSVRNSPSRTCRERLWTAGTPSYCLATWERMPSAMGAGRLQERGRLADPGTVEPPRLVEAPAAPFPSAGGDGVLEDHDAKPPKETVRGSVQHAAVGLQAGEHQGIHPQVPQRRLQVRREEAAVAALL